MSIAAYFIIYALTQCWLEPLILQTHIWDKYLATVLNIPLFVMIFVLVGGVVVCKKTLWLMMTHWQNLLALPMALLLAYILPNQLYTIIMGRLSQYWWHCVYLSPVHDNVHAGMFYISLIYWIIWLIFSMRYRIGNWQNWNKVSGSLNP